MKNRKRKEKRPKDNNFHKKKMIDIHQRKRIKRLPKRKGNKMERTIPKGGEKELIF